MSYFAPMGSNTLAYLRNVESPCSNQRYQRVLETLRPFDTGIFHAESKAYLDEKKIEYLSVRSGLFGSFRSGATHYIEKKEFYICVMRAVYECTKSNNALENIEALKKCLKEGAIKFVHSEIGRIYEKAYFSLKAYPAVDPVQEGVAMDLQSIPVGSVVELRSPLGYVAA